MKLIDHLFSHYRAYHQHGPLMLRYLSILGFIGFPLYYLLRFTKSTPPPFDDLPIRLVDAAMCFVLFAKDRWPARFKPYHLAYSYLVLIVTLPMTFVFVALKQGGGTIGVGNTLMAVFLVILLTDWRNMLVMLGIGFSAAVLLYVVSDPDPRMPVDYVQRLPILIAVMVGGSLFKFAAERATAEKMRHAYASLAGSIAHEMRNSLGQLKNSLDSMQEALPMPTTADQPQTLGAREVNALYRYLGQSELAVNRGLQVISMTLDQVSAKSLNTSGFSYLSAAEVTHKAVQDFGYESDLARGKVTVDVVEDFEFWGDETAYLFVLFNLIKNALYYVAVSPQTVVRITVSRHTIVVRDSGPGIAPEMLGQLFQPFRSTGKLGGTGLGLAYCQRVMAAFGGEIRCESVLGEFTQFVMRFPPVQQAEREAYRATALASAREAFAGKRLLVVDDDAPMRATTVHKLTPLDVLTDEAPDGVAALARLGHQRYDLVVLDLNMPGLDGYALAERVRQGVVPLNREVCIVAYTSEAAHVASVKTNKSGMDGFVVKPCAQLPLIQALHRALLRPAADRLVRSARLAGCTVLLADDNAVNRKAVVVYLKRLGALVVEVEHGQAVIDHLQAGGGVDVVLMDINMPGMGGVEATRVIRASPQPWRDVPVIALTAHADPTVAEAAFAAGMSDFLLKPVNAADLYQKLSHWLGPWSKGGPQAPLKAVAAPLPVVELLDRPRLVSYQQLGMLDELLDDYLPEIDRLVASLTDCVARQDLAGSLDALHSLLGLSGEAGALALYRQVQRVHAPMVEGRQWPADGDVWLAQIQALTRQTHEAVKTYRAATEIGNPP